jgi:hypothetical protein
VREACLRHWTLGLKPSRPLALSPWAILPIFFVVFLFWYSCNLYIYIYILKIGALTPHCSGVPNRSESGSRDSG